MADKTLPDASAGWGQETFALKHPFVLAGVEVREIKLRVPTGADVEAYIRAPERSLRAFALKLADAEPKAIDAMRGNDYSRLLKQVGEYLAGTD